MKYTTFVVCFRTYSRPYVHDKRFLYLQVVSVHDK